MKRAAVPIAFLFGIMVPVFATLVGEVSKRSDTDVEGAEPRVVVDSQRGVGPESSMALPSPAPTAPPPPTATAIPSPTPRSVTRDGALSGQTRYIANTEGLGIRVRTSCADNAPGGGAWPESAQVTVDYAQSDCPGWFLVRRAGNESSWVRSSYLSSSPPPTATPRPALASQPARPAPRPVPPRPACALPSNAVSFDPFKSNWDGSLSLQGRARNTCTERVSLMIETTARASEDGPPLMDSPTIFVDGIGANESKILIGRMPYASDARWITWIFSYFFSDLQENDCMDVGTSSCLAVDPWLTSTVHQLLKLERGQWLLRVAAEQGVTVRRARTNPGVLGQYNRSNRTVSLDDRLDSYSATVRASVLAHELQHAADQAAGRRIVTPSDCYLAEEDAFRRQAELWAQFWQYKLPRDVDTVHAELNDIALTVSRDPVGFAVSLTRRYHDQCGG